MSPILGVSEMLFQLFFCHMKEAGSIVGKSHPGPIPAGPFPDVTSGEPGQPGWCLLQNGAADASSLQDFFKAHSRWRKGVSS